MLPIKYDDSVLGLGRMVHGKGGGDRCWVSGLGILSEAPMVLTAFPQGTVSPGARSG